MELNSQFLLLLSEVIPQEEVSVFVKSIDKPINTFIRLNSYKSILSTPIGRAIEWCENDIALDKRAIFTIDPLFHAGCYYV